MTTHPESCVVPNVETARLGPLRIGLTPGRTLADHVDVPISITVFGVVDEPSSRWHAPDPGTNTSRTHRRSRLDTRGTDTSMTVTASKTRTPTEPRRCRRLTKPTKNAQTTTPSTLCAFVHTKKTTAQLAAVEVNIRRPYARPWPSSRSPAGLAESLSSSFHGCTDNSLRQHTHRNLANSQKSYRVDCAKYVAA
jgi:hypothetical protein